MRNGQIECELHPGERAAELRPSTVAPDDAKITHKDWNSHSIWPFRGPELHTRLTRELNYELPEKEKVLMADQISKLGFPYRLDFPTSCGHSLQYEVVWSTPFCGLCFLQEGYARETPQTLHRTRTLADNGKPDQTGAFQGHVRVVEGISLPVDEENLTAFRRRRARVEYSGNPYIFASALHFISGKQPPLAKPLIRAVVQKKTHDQICAEMDITLLNLVGRITKGVGMTTNFILKYSA